MEKLKKIIVIFSVAAILVLSIDTGALACDKAPDCQAQGENVVCGTQHATTTTHYVGYSNGYVGICAVDTVGATHYIYCAGCGSLLRTEHRICEVVHSDPHCFDDYNLCH